MDFSGLLNEALKAVERFGGVSCQQQVREERDGIVFLGYELAGASCLSGGLVEAGLLLRDGAIGGFYYRKGEEEKLTVFREDLLLDSLQKVIRELVAALAKDGEVGCTEWIELARVRAGTPLLKDRSCVINEKTGNRVTKLDRVLVDFGFAEAFATMVLGYAEGKYVLALTDSKFYWEDGRKTRRYLVLYEAVFESAEEGNKAFKKVKDSCFLSKKGNTVYRLEKEDFFTWFHQVEGSSLRLN